MPADELRECPSSLSEEVVKVLEDLASADVLRAELRARARAVLDRYKGAPGQEGGGE